MKVNVILAKHPGSGKEYCFAVSAEQMRRIHEGDWLLVSTMRGKKLAVAVCDPFTLAGNAIHILERFGAYLPLKPVLAFCPAETKNIMEYLQRELKNCELPF